METNGPRAEIDRQKDKKDRSGKEDKNETEKGQDRRMEMKTGETRQRQISTRQRKRDGREEKLGRRLRKYGKQYPSSQSLQRETDRE